MHQLTHSEIASLVVQAQDGNAEAFGLLYTATVRQQLQFATAFLKDEALAEDAVQEVYLSMYKALERLENPKTFVAYLNRICYNTCVDFQKKQSRQKYELNDEIITTTRDTAPKGTPQEQYEYAQEKDVLYEALDKLPEQHRAAFLLRYYNGYRIRKISETMDISESTAKRYIKAAGDTLSQEISTSTAIFEGR